MDDAAPLAGERARPSAYERDVIAWSREQAALLRSGRFSELDIEHIADEVEDVGRSEQNELASRLAVLLCHLLKWQLQPDRRGASWRRTIREQRKMVIRRLARTPSLKVDFADDEWLADVWSDAVSQTLRETDLETLPTNCVWPRGDILDLEFLPH